MLPTVQSVLIFAERFARTHPWSADIYQALGAFQHEFPRLGPEVARISDRHHNQEFTHCIFATSDGYVALRFYQDLLGGMGPQYTKTLAVRLGRTSPSIVKWELDK